MPRRWKLQFLAPAIFRLTGRYFRASGPYQRWTRQRNVARFVGGFDESYWPAYYEDADLSFKFRGLGYRTIYCPESVVIHREGGTSQEAWGDAGITAMVERNRAHFIDMWQAELLRTGNARKQKRSFLWPRARTCCAGGSHGVAEAQLRGAAVASRAHGDVRLTSDRLETAPRIVVVDGQIGCGSFLRIPA